MRSAHHSPIGTSPITENPEICPKCGAEVNASLRHCLGCATDIGFPNVRAASAPKEIGALASRFENARNSAADRGVADNFNGLVTEIDSGSFVLVALPTLVARTLFLDPRAIYAGYEDLLGAGIRTPAHPEDDSQRFAVAGKLFGSYARHIKYGVLALSDAGLPNYGRIFMRLRDEAVRHRVSFLHENSYLFLENHGVSAVDDIPIGFRSTWSSRSQLVGAKLEPLLGPNIGTDEWATMLVARGASRAEDQFVEAHIYGSFTAQSVHSVRYFRTGASRTEKMDIEIIEELVAKQSSTGEQE